MQYIPKIANFPSSKQSSNKDIAQLAKRLNLQEKQFDILLRSANYAYDFIKGMGPFYGREDIKEPTFRITAEPVKFPKGSREVLENLGEDLLYLGRSLSKLPDKYKLLLGKNIEFRVPISWRIDSIIDSNDTFKVNEIEGKDNSSALTMVEQLAYNLQSLNETTVGKLISTLDKIYSWSSDIKPLKIAFICSDTATNQYTPNSKRFIEFIDKLSKGRIVSSLYDIDELKAKSVIPDWSTYKAVINESYCSPYDLQALGVNVNQILIFGSCCEFVNKGLFALLHEPSLSNFWQRELSSERYEKLKQFLLPSQFVRSIEELRSARKMGKVVKVSWAEDNIMLINGARGVAMPSGDTEKSNDERWKLLENFLNQGYTLISQDFIQPKRIKAFLRKRGTTLEPVEWYNRTCIKYVAEGDPNGQNIPKVWLTAAEVTLGPEIIPAGRQCAFTAGEFI